ncbi:MAG: BatA domain-containing protein, partial [Bacteroidota bacterium]
MQFVQPAILWGLLTLSIPILIHLFHFRRFKKVYFNNVHLLKEIKEETSNRNKVKNLLVLLTRLLALGALIFAFAQPFLSAEDKDATTRRSVQIFLDNSFSMESTSEEVPLFTRAKDLAREVIDGHAEFDEYLILTHDLEAKHQRYVDQQTALGFIDEIKITPEVESLDQLMSVMDRLHDRGTESIVERYLISDFQSNISQIQTPVDTSISLLLLPVRSVQESNVTISDAKWSTPVPVRDEQNQLLVTLENYSSQEQEVELRMTLNGVARPLGAIVVPAGSEIVDTALINLPAIGWQELVLEITDYPIAFDNEYFAAFQMREEI